MTQSTKLLPTQKHFQLDNPSRVLIGWQEWCALPTLGIPAIKSKIDTGAKTSALHASDIRPFHRQGELFVHFLVHPLQQTVKFPILCTALVHDQRIVMNSGGQKELRYVINTPVMLGETTWDIEITLTNRDPMRFRMLLGRDALKNHSIIDPGKFLCQGKLTTKKLHALYKHHEKDSAHP